MLGNEWFSSQSAAEKLGLTEIKLSHLRESGILKPGIHWKSSPYGQRKPWNPDVLYNYKFCKLLITKSICNNQVGKYAA